MTEKRGVSRREFIALASASALAVAPGCRSEKTTTGTPAASPDPLLELTAVDVVAKMRNGEVTAERYASALLEQCQKGKALNAFITLPQEQVLEAARTADRLRTSGEKLGALHGISVRKKMPPLCVRCLVPERLSWGRRICTNCRGDGRATIWRSVRCTILTT